MSCQSFMQYTQLKAGDVRQKGDEVATRNFTNTPGNKLQRDSKPTLTPFLPVHLVSYPILASDLVHLEFRRPLS